MCTLLNHDLKHKNITLTEFIREGIVSVTSTNDTREFIIILQNYIKTITNALQWIFKSFIITLVTNAMWRKHPIITKYCVLCWVSNSRKSTRKADELNETVTKIFTLNLNMIIFPFILGNFCFFLYWWAFIAIFSMICVLKLYNHLYNVTRIIIYISI